MLDTSSRSDGFPPAANWKQVGLVFKCAESFASQKWSWLRVCMEGPTDLDVCV